MKIVIINKSDTTGGAAVVSRRLMDSLRREGADARMLVVEKLGDSPYVEEAAPRWREKIPFLKERLGIFIENGFDRSTLFRIDSGGAGLPLWRHPLVVEADAVLLNWVNQGMLSLEGVERIAALGKPVVWTMHDMWCFTGICHHAGECGRFRKRCGLCPLLGSHRGDDDLSRRVWERKGRLPAGIRYVAVSNWLRERAGESSLLAGADVRVIPNAFPMAGISAAERSPKRKDEKVRLLFGAARLDDPVKGLPALIEATKILRGGNPRLAERLELTTFGAVKNPDAFSGLAIPAVHLGTVIGDRQIREVYESADILVSASQYETLPGTLVEAQAYGCIPVSFSRGGQADIVDHGATGWLSERPGKLEECGRKLAEGIEWAVGVVEDPERYPSILREMRENVARRFSPEGIARQYLDLIKEIENT